jgi:hypothetical protein
MGPKLNAAMDKDSQVVALENNGETRRASSYMSLVPDEVCGASPTRVPRKVNKDGEIKRTFSHITSSVSNEVPNATPTPPP